MEDERQKAETFLKSLPDLLQEICRLLPPGVFSVSAELDTHLDELADRAYLFLGLPCSVRDEYQRKAGEVVVNSGLIAMLCEKTTTWLEDKQGDDETDVIWALLVCTERTQILLKKDGDLHLLLPLLVNLLKESFLDHMAGTLQQGVDKTLIGSLGVLSGLAEVEENKQHLRGLSNIQSVLRAYSRSENEWIFYNAVITMALVVTERRADASSPNHDMVQFLLGQLKALEHEGFNPHDLKLRGVFGAVNTLTWNAGNRERLVQEGVLPYLEKVLVKCVSENNCKEQTTCANIVITLQNLACEERNEAEVMKHTQLLDTVVSISIDQSHSHRLGCIESAKDALSNLDMNPQDLQDDGSRRTGFLCLVAPYNHINSETEDSGRQIPMSAPQRMDSTNNGLTSSLPNGSPNLFSGVQLGNIPHSGSTCMTGFQTPIGMPLPMRPGFVNNSFHFMPHGAMSNRSQTNHAPPLVSSIHTFPPFGMPYNVPASGAMDNVNGMHYGSLSNNVQLGDVPPCTTPGHQPPARMNSTVPYSDLMTSVPHGGIQTNAQPGFFPHLSPNGMSSDCPARNTTGNLTEDRRSNDLQTASFSNSMNGMLEIQNYLQPGNVHSGNTPSSGTHGSMHDNHGGVITNTYCTPSFGVTGGAPGLGMMGHEPNTTILPDPRNAPKSISGNIRPEEETLNVGISQVVSCTQIDPHFHSTVPVDSAMNDDQLSTIDSSSIRPTPSLPVVSRTESLRRNSVMTTAPFSGNTTSSTCRSATAKSSSTDTGQQGSLSPGPSSTAGNSSSHAPPAISMSTTGGGLPSSSTFAKPSTPIVPGSGPDFSVLSPCETLDSYKPQLPLYHESNLQTPCPPSVSSESASTPRSPDQQHITSPESRGSFSPSQPSPGQPDGVTTSEHAQEGFCAPPSPPHPGLPPADMNQEGSSLYRPDEEEAQTCGIISKADGKPAVLPSNPESKSSGKAKNRAKRTVASSKSSNKRAKLLPKLETVSSDGAMCQPETAASSSKSKKKRTKLSSNPVTGSSSRDTRIDRDMETEATSVTLLSTTIIKAEGKRPRHYGNPKGGVSSHSKVAQSHTSGMLNQFQKSAQNGQPPFKVSRDDPCRDEVPSNPCKSPRQNSYTEQQICTKKRLTCPCCPSDFVSTGDLKAHLMQEKHFKCKKCEKRFSYKKTHAKHVKDKHDPKKASSYTCATCQHTFGSERYLKEHKTSHDVNAKKRFRCPKCGKEYKWRSSLKKHKDGCNVPEEHSEDRSKCPKCEKVYEYRLSLNQHIKICKKEVVDTLALL